MCNYCGCREIATVAALTEEHEQLLYARGELGRALDRGEVAGAVQWLRRIVGTLAVHDAVEELGFYPALLAVEGYTTHVESMFDDHDEIGSVLEAALTAAGGTPEAVDWAAVRHALDHLARHIDAEEHGLFPAAAVTLDAEAWEQVEAVRAHVEGH